MKFGLYERYDPEMEKLRTAARPLVDDLDEFEDREKFYTTWNFGMDREGHVTAGVDITLDFVESEEEKEEILNQLISIFRKNGFELDDRYKPGRGLFGSYHYQIIQNGELTEDTEKNSKGKWVNKGKEGTHGEFKTKKEADAQRKAMFANGYRESLGESNADKIDRLKRELASVMKDICDIADRGGNPERYHYRKNKIFDELIALGCNDGWFEYCDERVSESLNEEVSPERLHVVIWSEKLPQLFVGGKVKYVRTKLDWFNCNSREEVCNELKDIYNDPYYDGCTVTVSGDGWSMDGRDFIAQREERVSESLEEGTVVGGELLRNLSSDYWNRTREDDDYRRDYNHKFVGRRIVRADDYYERFPMTITSVYDNEYIEGKTDNGGTFRFNLNDKDKLWKFIK